MLNLKPTLKYFILTLKHKYFVFKAGLKLDVPIYRLLRHDISKFYFSELPNYGNQFFGPGDKPNKFIRAWLKHQNRNDHHWEFWIPRTGHNRCKPPYPNNEPLEMSKNSTKEMIADWIGATRAYDGKWPDIDNWEWFNKNFNKIKIHENTRKYIIELLKIYKVK